MDSENFQRPAWIILSSFLTPISNLTFFYSRSLSDRWNVDIKLSIFVPSKNLRLLSKTTPHPLCLLFPFQKLQISSQSPRPLSLFVAFCRFPFGKIPPPPLASQCVNLDFETEKKTPRKDFHRFGIRRRSDLRFTSSWNLGFAILSCVCRGEREKGEILDFVRF